MSTEQTIGYLTNRLEVVLPEQMEQAAQVLGRMTLNYYGQLSLFDEGKAEVLELFPREAA